MTELPANVKKQAQKAEELMKKQKEKKQQQQAKPAIENKGQAPPPQEAPKPKEEGRPPEQPSPPPPTQQQQQATDWETKYKVLKGKYDAEVNADVTQLREEINKLKQTNEVLQQRLIEASDTIGTLNEMLAKAQVGQLPAQQMQQQPQQGQYQQAPPGQQEMPELLDKEDFEGYGEQFFKLVDIINRQEQEIQRLKALTHQTVELSREEKINRFYDELKRLVPRYELINFDTRFIKWLEEYDQARGATRWDIFQERCRALDPEGAAYYFNEFIKTLPPHERTIYEVAPTEQPGSVQGQPQVDYGAQAQEQVQVPGVESQVMPDTTSSGPTFETPAITAQDVQAAAERYSRGKISLDEYLAISKSFQQQIANELRR